MRRLTKTADPESALRATALNLLARREHAALELRQKLTRRGFAGDAVDRVLERLRAEGWQDDTRFAEVYATSRIDKGYGPLRLRRELKERGITDTIVDTILAQFNDSWTARLKALHHRRFGEGPPGTPDERARRLRFLRQRGFTVDQIMQLFKLTENDR